MSDAIVAHGGWCEPIRPQTEMDRIQEESTKIWRQILEETVADPIQAMRGGIQFRSPDASA